MKKRYKNKKHYIKKDGKTMFIKRNGTGLYSFGGEPIAGTYNAKFGKNKITVEVVNVSSTNL